MVVRDRIREPFVRVFLIRERTVHNLAAERSVREIRSSNERVMRRLPNPRL